MARHWPPLRTAADRDAIEAVPLAGWELPESTYALLAEAAREYGDIPAAITLRDADDPDPHVLDHRGFLGRVHRYANALRELGIGREDAVAVMASPSATGLAVTLAAETAGIVAPVSKALRSVRLAELMGRSRADVLVAVGPEIDGRRWGKALLAASGMGIRAVLALRPDGATGPGPRLPEIPGVRVAYLDDLAAEQPDDSLTFDDRPGADDIAAFFHTGGTIGDPKLVAHTHGAQVFAAWSAALVADFAPGSRVLSGLPLYHVDGLITTGLSPLMRGQTIVSVGDLGYRDERIYAGFWRVVERLRIRGMSTVPTVYARLAGIPVDADIGSLVVCAVGAAPMPAWVETRFREATGIGLVEGYGLTEGTCVSVVQPVAEPRRGSLGLRLPYQDVAVVRARKDGTVRMLRPGAVGQLAVRGPAVMPGYVLTRDGERVLDPTGAVVGGWLLTGDRASIDEDGYVWFHGRLVDMINRHGHNIDPRLIEDAMERHPAVVEAMAVGRPDRGAGEVPVVFVEAPGADAAELLAWARENVPERRASPRAVYILDELPRTEIGKPAKLTLRAEAARRGVGEDLLAAGFAVHPDDVVARVVDGDISVIVPTPESAGAAHELREALTGYAVEVHLL